MVYILKKKKTKRKRNNNFYINKNNKCYRTSTECCNFLIFYSRCISVLLKSERHYLLRQTCVMVQGRPVKCLLHRSAKWVEAEDLTLCIMLITTLVLIIRGRTKVTWKWVMLVTICFWCDTIVVFLFESFVATVLCSCSICCVIHAHEMVIFFCVQRYWWRCCC